MGIRESLLNTITSVGNGDFIRIVTSAGASSKATLQNVIKSFETNLGAKSSLADSDYIRIVGSDNNLYKQSVSSMKSDMGISALEANDGTKIYNGTDLNTLALPANYKKIRVYYGEDITQMTNRPSVISSAWPFCLICLPIGGFYTKQILHMYGTTNTPNNEYVRTQSYISGSTAWTDWQQSPTRAEVDALNSRITWASAIELPLSNCSAYNYVGARYKMVGSTCHVLISVSELPANSRVKIATLPSGSRPMMNSPFLGAGGLSYTAMAHITVNTSGEIYVLSDDTYATAYFNFICF